MNCQDFNSILDKFADGELNAKAQAAIREHLGHCANCRAALQRHTTLGDSIRDVLDRTSAGVSVRPDMQRRILQALESEAASGHERISLRAWLRFGWIRFVVPGAALLVILILGIRFYDRQGQAPKTCVANQTALGEYMIDVPIQTQTYVFQREGDRVVDAIVPTGEAGHARLVAKSE